MHIAVALIIGLLIVTFVAQRTVVFNYSMEPTLHEGDNLIVEKITPRLGKLERGDIVTIKDASLSLSQQDKTIIKRVIALENDMVNIKDGRVYINGELLTEDYINGSYTKNVNMEYSVDYKVPEGFIYVLGDNRKENIIDSRTIGAVSLNKITSKAVFRIFPFDKIGVP